MCLHPETIGRTVETNCSENISKQEPVNNREGRTNMQVNKDLLPSDMSTTSTKTQESSFKEQIEDEVMKYDIDIKDDITAKSWDSSLPSETTYNSTTFENNRSMDKMINVNETEVEIQGHSGKDNKESNVDFPCQKRANGDKPLSQSILEKVSEKGFPELLLQYYVGKNGASKNDINETIANCRISCCEYDVSVESENYRPNLMLKILLKSI